MTTTSYVAFAAIESWPVVGLSIHSADSHFVMYFMSNSWSNKDSLTIAFTHLLIRITASHSGTITTAIADPLYANNKSVKAPFTRI